MNVFRDIPLITSNRNYEFRSMYITIILQPPPMIDTIQTLIGSIKRIESNIHKTILRKYSLHPPIRIFKSLANFDPAGRIIPICFFLSASGSTKFFKFNLFIKYEGTYKNTTR